MDSAPRIEPPTAKSKPPQLESETRPKVLIVGAGLGGLMLGNILEKMGIPYEIYERSEKVRPLGSALSLSASVMPLMEQLGLLEDLNKISLPIRDRQLYTAEMQEIVSITSEGQFEVAGYDACIFARPDLHHLLLSRIPPEKIFMKKKVLSMEQSQYGVMIRCSDNKTHHGDVLVGADGAHSGVRQSLYKKLKDEKVLPASDKKDLTLGYMMMVGVTKALDPEEFPVLKDDFVRFGDILDGKNNSCTTITTTGNRICWAIAKEFTSNAEARKYQFSNSEWRPEANEEMIREFRDKPSPFGKTMGALIDATPAELTSRVFLEEKFFETWTHGRTVLMGDAIHKVGMHFMADVMLELYDTSRSNANFSFYYSHSTMSLVYKMLPASGQGCVNAFQDAVILANCLNDIEEVTVENIEAALKDYKDQRYADAKLQFHNSKFIAKLMMGQKWSDNLARKIVFKWLPNKLIIGAYIKQASYRPQINCMPYIENRGTGPVRPQKPSTRYAKQLLEAAKNLEEDKKRESEVDKMAENTVAV